MSPLLQTDCWAVRLASWRFRGRRCLRRSRTRRWRRDAGRNPRPRERNL